MLSVGEKFPAFSLQGINEKNEFVRVEVNESYMPQKKQWSVVYFYPKDFTFICPTEIAGFDCLVDDANVIGISGDNEFCKLAWKQDNNMIGNISHTLAADCGLGLSHQLGIVNEEEGVPYRATFIFDKNRIVQHVSINALDTGRNAQEVLRTLKALQAGGLTGCAWNEGEEFDTQSLISGASALSRRNVSKVFSGLARGSPGPAMPSTVICGIFAATALVFITASSGVNNSDTTPGRDSLAQSYFLLQ